MTKDMLGDLVRLLVTVSNETLALIFDCVQKISDPEMLSEFKKFLRKETCWGAGVKTATVKVNKFFKLLFKDLKIDATDGSETLKSSGIFTGGVYGQTLPLNTKITKAVKASVWEMALDGIFAKLFSSFGSRKKRGTWTEHQVVEFCRSHRDKLRTDGYATFFEIEGGFVANVRFVGDGRLLVRVIRFSRAYLWNAQSRNRFVILQLET